VPGLFSRKLSLVLPQITLRCCYGISRIQRPAFAHLARQDDRRLGFLGPLSRSMSSVRASIISIATASGRLLYHMYLGSSHITQSMFYASAGRQDPGTGLEHDLLFLVILCIVNEQPVCHKWDKEVVLPSIFQHMPTPNIFLSKLARSL